MKKIKLSIVMLLAASVSLFAQKAAPVKTQNYPCSYINLGIGLGSPYWDSEFKSTLPFNPTLTFEHSSSSASVNPMSGSSIGDLLSLLKNMTIGGSITYSGSKYEYKSDYYNYDVNYTALFINARTSYHFIKSGKLDPYAGVGVGYVIVSESVDDSYTGTYYGTGASSGMGYAVYGGVRYMPAKHIGVYGELGYTSLAVLSLGATFRLK